MADMVMAASVDAAGDFQLQLADVALPLERGEAARDVLRHDDRARIGQRAIVEAGASDDVGDEVGVGRRQLDFDQLVVDRLEVGARHVRQDQVLLVADPDLVERICLGDIGDRFHLAVAGVAGRLADAFQRDRHRGIVGMPVRDDVLVEPFAKAAGIEPGKPDGLVALRPCGQRRRREIGADRARCRPRAASARYPSARPIRHRPGGRILPRRSRAPGS